MVPHGRSCPDESFQLRFSSLSLCLAGRQRGKVVAVAVNVSGEWISCVFGGDQGQLESKRAVCFLAGK